MIISYVIYDDPSDFPGKFVLRRWVSENFEPVPDPEPLAVVDTLEEARESLPADVLGMFLPHKSDDPKIKEIWI